MRHYERYLLLHLLWPTVLITLSLTAIVWLTQVLRFLDFILNRGLSLGDFLTLTGLMLPSLLLVLIPVSLTIAVLYTYNKLTVESELVVLGAVGVSKWQLARPARMIGVVAMLICYALSLHIMPVANQRFRDIRSVFRDKYASVLLEEEVFNSPMDGVTVFIRERDYANHLSGILLHDSRDAKKTMTLIADRGRVEQTPAGPKFYLQNGLRQQVQEGRVSWLKFDEYAIELAFYGTTNSRKYTAEERTIGELFARTGLPEKEMRAYRAEAHQRLTWPILALSLPLMALAMLFSSEFSRRGQGKRIAAAAIMSGIVVLVYFSLRNFAVKQAWLGGGMYLVVLGVFAFSAWILITNRVIGGIPFPFSWPLRTQRHGVA